MAARPEVGISWVDDAEEWGVRRMREFDVFFWRSLYVFPGVFRRAFVSVDLSVMLCRR